MYRHGPCSHFSKHSPPPGLCTDWHCSWRTSSDRGSHRWSSLHVSWGMSSSWYRITLDHPTRRSPGRARLGSKVPPSTHFNVFSEGVKPGDEVSEEHMEKNEDLTRTAMNLWVHCKSSPHISIVHNCRKEVGIRKGTNISKCSNNIPAFLAICCAFLARPNPLCLACAIVCSFKNFRGLGNSVLTRLMIARSLASPWKRNPLLTGSWSIVTNCSQKQPSS